MKKILWLLFFLLFLFPGCEDRTAKISLEPEEQVWLSLHSEELYFAPDPFYAPFEFYDRKDGDYKGLVHDYVDLIEKKLGVRFKIIKVQSFNQILTLAKEKRVAIVNAVTETPERSEYLLFTKPIIEIKNVILVPKGGSRNLSLKDLKGKNVSLVSGYAITEYLLKKYPEIDYEIVPTDLNAILNVAYKISDAAIIDLATASFLTEREGISNIQVAGDAGYPVRLAIGSRKDWPEFNKILSRALDSITSNERDEIRHKWIGFEKTDFTDLPAFRITVIIIVFLTAAVGFIALWNKQLKRQILLRTSSLDRALRDLKESEDQHRSILHTATDGFWLLNLNGGLLEVNESYCRMTGYTEKELLTMNISDLEAAEDRTEISVRMEKVIESGEQSFESAHRRKDGSVFNVEVNVQYKPSGDGRFVAFLRDITGRKLTELKIQKLLAEKELLLQEVHHRIKNNMNTIKGLLTLQLSAEENPSAAESLRDAESRVQSMIMLYDRLYSTDNFRELSIKTYLEPLTLEIVGSFPNNRIVTVETVIDDFILNVNLLTPLGIIVNELLTNMMKYAFKGRESGVITVSAFMKDSHATVVVKDNGIGIPESVSFENSSGFGLSLVSMLIEQIGGSIRIKRENGTEFVLEFDV